MDGKTTDVCNINITSVTVFLFALVKNVPLLAFFKFLLSQCMHDAADEVFFLFFFFSKILQVLIRKFQILNSRLMH